MRRRNEGTSEEDILQNQFTAYLVTAIRRQRIIYLRRRDRHMLHEVSLEICDAADTALFTEPDLTASLSLLEQIESPALHRVLLQARERERYIFLTRVLDDRSFTELAQELGISYKAVTHLYYRFIDKLRKGGEKK